MSNLPQVVLDASAVLAFPAGGIVGGTLGATVNAAELEATLAHL